MTKTARKVLQDLDYAIETHSPGLLGESFRVSWFAIISLLRAVGHVLRKVDAQRSPALARAVETKWNELQRSKPEPAIFWGFIESERNQFLKNYEHSVLRTTPSSDDSRNGEELTVHITWDLSNCQGIGFFPNSSDSFDSRLRGGPFAGEHEKVVARRAAVWWRAYLDDVDRLADVARESCGRSA